MKRLVLLMLAALMVVALGGRAEALPFATYQDQDVTFDPLFGGVAHYTWTFDLDNDPMLYGDVNAGDTINDAGLAITVNEFQIIPDVGLLVLDSIPVYLGSVVSGTHNLNVYALIADHTLVVDIYWVFGHFTVTSMTVFGDYTPAGGPSDPDPVVPEPATMALGLMGLTMAGFVRRRRRLAA